MNHIATPRYAVRLARTEADLARVLALRAQVFRAGADDRDAHDARCRHLIVEDRTERHLVACCRLVSLHGPAEIAQSYSARTYDLTPLTARTAPMIEIGRVCTAPNGALGGAPGGRNPDILRALLAGIARMVAATGAGMLIGCASFAGSDPAAHLPALAYLGARHLGPALLRPGRRAAEVIDLRALVGQGGAQVGLAGLPPLLRSYLALGAWVGDHAVIDADLGTVHVFTALEITAIPPGRARALIAAAGVLA